MNLRIAKKIALTPYRAHVYTPGQRSTARKVYFRAYLRGLRTLGHQVPDMTGFLRRV